MNEHEPSSEVLAISDKIAEQMRSLQKFYFTYASNPGFPFQDGWTVVYAKNRSQACDIFNVVHPYYGPSKYINCSWIYTQTEFEQTSMYLSGKNFEQGCVETLGLWQL